MKSLLQGGALLKYDSLYLIKLDKVTMPHPAVSVLCAASEYLLYFQLYCGTHNSLWSLQKLMDEVPLGDKVPRKK